VVLCKRTAAAAAAVRSQFELLLGAWVVALMETFLLGTFHSWAGISLLRVSNIMACVTQSVMLQAQPWL
jgi:hypothetical protein